MNDEPYNRACTNQRYATGRPYRPLRARFAALPANRRPGASVALNLNSTDPSWPVFWRHVRDKLRSAGYAPGALVLYRQVLRLFARTAGCRPAQVDVNAIRAYTNDVVKRRCSSDWLAGNISILRTVFDKIGGLAVMQGFETPKRAWRLPEILNVEEVKRILQAATTLRDQCSTCNA